MRRLLAVAGTLVVIIGLPLYLVPQNSGEYFSWAVRRDLSAAFLGGAYLAAAVIEYAAARERAWANARIAVPAVLVFTVLTLLVTLGNLDSYNFNAPSIVQSIGTWAWLIVYVVVPPIMLVVLLLQVRRGGNDPRRMQPIPVALRRVLLVGGLLLAVGGLMMLLDPDTRSWMWPWPVTALTARAFGAWMMGFAVAMIQIAFEADWRRVRPATAGAGVLGILQLIALVRYLDEPDWSSMQAWIYLLLLVSFVALGFWGWRMAGDHEHPDKA